MTQFNRFRLALLTALCCLGVLAANAAVASAEFGLVPGGFSVTATDADGNTQAQAGARTDVTTTFELNLKKDAEGNENPDQDLRDVRVKLPPERSATPTRRRNARPASSTAKAPPSARSTPRWAWL